VLERLTKVAMRTAEQDPLPRRRFLRRFGKSAAAAAGALGAFLAFSPQAQAGGGCFQRCYNACIKQCGHTPECEAFCDGQCFQDCIF
jgi:hypothetical protein